MRLVLAHSSVRLQRQTCAGTSMAAVSQPAVPSPAHVCPSMAPLSVHTSTSPYPAGTGAHPGSEDHHSCMSQLCQLIPSLAHTCAPLSYLLSYLLVPTSNLKVGGKFSGPS